MSSKCGEHHYGNITKTKIDQILEQLKNNGASISGNNPWGVDIHKYGIKLQGAWNESNLTLSITVIEKDFYVPCSKIWDTIDPLIHHISGLRDSDVE
jgi:hypothetical protein